MAFGKQYCLAENIPAIPIISSIPCKYQITTNKIFNSTIYMVFHFEIFLQHRNCVAFEREMAKVQE